MKVAVIYWSSTGNTKHLAEVISREISKKYETALREVTDVDNLKLIEDSDIILLGCPAMGAEELDSEDFEPFYLSIKDILKNKKVGLFGSYEWAEGEWMIDWEKDARDSGIDVVAVCAVHESENEDFDGKDFVSNF